MTSIPLLIDLNEIPWEPFGRDTEEIFRKNLCHLTFPSGSRASLTLAKPGGLFPDHVDPYGHIFYILEGEGEAWIEGETFPFRKGISLSVPAGKKHGYRNCGSKDLLLITINLY